MYTALQAKTDKAVPSAAGNLASLDSQGNLADSGMKPSDFATKTDISYALVTPGEWEFSGISLDDYDVEDPAWNSDIGNWQLSYVNKTSGI